MVGICCRIVIAILFMGLAYSCGSSRKMEQSNSVATVQSTSSENTSFNYGSTTKLTDFVKTDFGIRFQWVKYDTSKQPDKEGNYPKQEEGSGELDLKTEGNKSVESGDSLQVDTDRDSAFQSDKAEHSVSEKEKEGTEVFSDITWLCVAISVLVIIIFIVVKLCK